MLGQSGIANSAIAGFPPQAGIPLSPFYQTDWPVPRGHVPGIDLKTWLHPLNPALYGADRFFGAGGPRYDYPNPGIPLRSVELLTWLHSVNLNLLSEDTFFGTTAPGWDYPNPRAPQSSIDLKNYTWRNSAILATQYDLFGHPNYDQPNPRGPVGSISLRTYLYPTQIQLSDHTRGLGGFPNWDWPNPRGYVPNITLKTWINQFNIQLGRIIGVPTLAFAKDWATSLCTVGALPAVICTANDSPSGQDWSGSGYMAKYEIDTSIELEGVFLNALQNVYIDPTEVRLAILDPDGNFIEYTTLQPSTIIRQSAGYYTFTFVPNISGVWTYKWIGTGAAPATSPDTTFTVNASVLIAG